MPWLQTHTPECMQGSDQLGSSEDARLLSAMSPTASLAELSLAGHSDIEDQQTSKPPLSLAAWCQACWQACKGRCFLYGAFLGIRWKELYLPDSRHALMACVILPGSHLSPAENASCCTHFSTTIAHRSLHSCSQKVVSIRYIHVAFAHLLVLYPVTAGQQAEQSEHTHLSRPLRQHVLPHFLVHPYSIGRLIFKFTDRPLRCE